MIIDSADMDQGELLSAKLDVRSNYEHDAVVAIQEHYGKNYDSQIMQESYKNCLTDSAALLVSQIKQAEGVAEVLKASEQMEWVRCMIGKKPKQSRAFQNFRPGSMTRIQKQNGQNNFSF